MPAWIDAFSWIGLTVLLGFSTARIILRRGGILTWWEELALAFPLGAGVIGLYMGIEIHFGLSGHRFQIALLALAVWGLSRYFRRAPLSVAAGTITAASGPLRGLDHFFIAAIVAQTANNFFRALIKPWTSSDFMEQFGLSAKIMYMAGGIPTDYVAHFQGVIPNLQYPPLLIYIPVSFYCFQGFVNDSLVNIIYPLYYLSFLVLFYGLLRRFVNRRSALLFTFLLATVKQFADYGSFANRDMIFAFYGAFSVFFMYLWFERREREFFGLALVLSVLALYAKAEGMMLFLVNSGVILCNVLRGNRQRWRAGLLYAAAAVLAISVYVGTTRASGMAVHDSLRDFSPLQVPLKLVERLHTLPQILNAYQRQYFGPKKWNILWVIFFVSLIVHFGRIFSERMQPLSLWLLMLFLGYTAVYLLADTALDWQLSTTVARLFIHGLPVAVFYMALLWKESTIDLLKD